MNIDHGSIIIREETIIILQDGNEVFLRHSEMDELIKTYSNYKKQQSVDKSVKGYINQPSISRLIAASKRVNPDAPGNVSYLYD